jgi:hypothetical protein
VAVQQQAEAKQSRSPCHGSLHGRPFRAGVFQAERQFFGDGGPDRGQDGRCVLRNVTHLPAPLGGVDPRIVGSPFELQGGSRKRQLSLQPSAGPWREPPCQEPAQRGLAAAGRPQDCRKSSGFNGDVHVTQDRRVVIMESEAPDAGGKGNGGFHLGSRLEQPVGNGSGGQQQDHPVVDST